jgi:flagellin-like protein
MLLLDTDISLKHIQQLFQISYIFLTILGTLLRYVEQLYVRKVHREQFEELGGEREKMSTKKIDRKGVSPVIGVILMVAATIVIAGVVMAMLGGFKAPASSKVVGVYQNRINTTAIQFTVTKIEPSGTVLHCVNVTSPSDVTGKDAWNDYTDGITVGETYTYVDTKLTGPIYVVLKGTFNDGSSEVVFANTI